MAITTSSNPTTDEGVPVATSRKGTAAAAATLLGGFFFLMVGNGLQGSLLGVRAEAESFSTLWTGLIMTAYYGGFLLGTTMAARSLAAVGHVRVFAALASLASAATLVHAVAIYPPVWVGMRFLTGVCMAGIYVTTESWLNDLATNEIRGRILAAYMIASMGGLGVGQVLLTSADPSTLTLFVVASVLISVSLVPVSLSTSPSPDIQMTQPMGMRELLSIAPTGAFVIMINGLTVGAILGMGAVYATRQGIDAAGVALFVGLPIAGSVAFQYPIGMISDRVPRRGLIIALALITAASSLTLMALPIESLATAVMLFVFGGTLFPLYSLGMATANDWIPKPQMMAASSSLVRLSGMSAIAGPLITAIVFATVGDRWFFVIPAISHVILAAYVAYRVMVRDAMPVDRQRPWVSLTSRGTYVLSTLARTRGVSPSPRR